MQPSTRDLQSQLSSQWDVLAPSPEDRALLERAMAASFAVHDGQLRPNGLPYPDHPLTVALRMLTAGAAPTRSHLVAALLHDAVEDAHEALVTFLGGRGAGASREEAFQAISDHLDPLAAAWIRAFTNPEFDPARKNELYRAHVVDLVDHAPDAFLVKFEDFSENALSLGGLEEGPRKQKLRAKYGPVVRGLRDRLSTLDPSHPLAPHRRRMLAALDGALAGEYAGH